MKKFNSLVLTMFFFLLVLTACKKMTTQDWESILIQEFLVSPDFRNNNFLDFNMVDYEKSKVTYVNDDISKPVINIVFSHNNKVIGSIEAIKNVSGRIKLPNNGTYFMFYHNYEQFDFEKLSGAIKLFDLNYDNHFFGYGEIVTGKLDINFYNPLPTGILQKYADIISFNLSNYKSLGDTNTKFEANPCDGNSDGNISFSECYKCFNNACSTDETCFVLCFLIGDVVGMSVSPAKIPLCQTSIAASCIYISIAY